MSEQGGIAILDFGGQYAHLIASRIRALGAHSEIVHTRDAVPAEIEKRFQGLVYSGGPGSVYEAGAPSADPRLLQLGLPTLGICYGHQLIMHQLSAVVEESDNREYGPATLEVKHCRGLFAGEEEHREAPVWMSHGDEVRELPRGFEVLATTADCLYAAVAHSEKRITGLQFHPEVVDTARGGEYLTNFIRQCGLENSWRLEDYLEHELTRIHSQVGEKKVFFLVSGGVDSTVAYTLLGRALPHEHLRGLLVDTGFMRHNEVSGVVEALGKQGIELEVHDASELYFEKLAGIADPEKKRRIIGELFIDIQEKVSAELGLNSDEWFLGQGTIYPDRIESGATDHSHKIKTHHNRVGRVEELLAQGRVVEPIGELYKDEVRRLGRLLDLPDALVDRHPFPGPGLAVRCLCADAAVPAGDLEARLDAELAADHTLGPMLRQRDLTARVLPVRSVGVQGDKRSYAHPAVLISGAGSLAEAGLTWDQLGDMARRIPNNHPELNRVLLCCGGFRPEDTDFEVAEAYLTPQRVERLRQADHIVTEFMHRHELYSAIWQFPVVIAPVRVASRSAGERSEETVILRPVTSTEAMTAGVYPTDFALVDELAGLLLQVPGVAAVCYDLTTKPPGTIEWE